MKVFVVEDNVQYATFLDYHISQNPEYVVETYKSGVEVLNNLYRLPDAITLDYGLPDMNGNRVMQHIKDAYPDVPIIIISGQDDVSTAIELLDHGAYEYIVKNDNTKERVSNALKNIRKEYLLKRELKSLKEEIQQKYEFDKVIKGTSPAIRKVFNLMSKATKTNINVSVSGETGTGKELVAKSIHYNSNRASKPFVAVNIAAIPKDLIESELFGHEKGAFTGAVSRRIGKFEEAGSGTIFLDEIGEMPINMQAKILRVLQEKEVTRVGGTETVKIDARIIVATHKKLLDEVKKGVFREDLYYRLLGLPIELPPLRERGNDVILLANHFINGFCEDNDMEPLVLGQGAKEKLLKYPFPGNIRELKAVVELAAVMCSTRVIEAEDITLNATSSISDLFMEELTLRDYTNKIVRYYLDKYDENVVLVADKLNVGKSTIYRMLKNKEI